MLLDTIKQKYREAKGEMQGRAVTRARLIRALVDIDHRLLRAPHTHRAPRRTGVVLRDRRGVPYEYYDDGSLRLAARSVFGTRRESRQAARRARRRA